MSDHPLIEERRESARHALNAFQQLPGRDSDDLTDIGDLIVNLLHLADEEGMNDAEVFLNMQREHFECERDPDDLEESARALHDADNA